MTFVPCPVTDAWAMDFYRADACLFPCNTL